MSIDAARLGGLRPLIGGAFAVTLGLGALIYAIVGTETHPWGSAQTLILLAIAVVLLGGMGTVLGPLIGAIVLSVVNELLWASYPQLYLAFVGAIILAAVLFTPRGLVSLGMKRGWLPTGRALSRRPALREPKAT